MNCALISAEALREVGFLSGYFRHRGADMEFGLKLRKAGGTVWLTPGAIGKCDRNAAELAATRENLSAREKFRRMTGVKGEPPSVRARYFRDHGGILWPVLWAGPYLRILISAIGEALRGKR
jgi:GT2 family glycosyltransferase